jgi:hypothetical protein
MKKYIAIVSIFGLLLIIEFYLDKEYKKFKEMKPKIEFLEKMKNSPNGGLPKYNRIDRMNDGDIVFHKSLSSQSEAISLATHSEYTHCGIVYKIGNEYFIYEAIEPVKLTPFQEWMGKGKGGDYVVKRLTNASEILTPAALQKLKLAGDRYKGKHYDSYFEWTDDKIYCSELIYKIYKEATGIEIGKLQTLKDFDLSSDAVRVKMKERYGNKYPLDEIVISPSSIFNSDLLTTVEE